MLCDPGIDLRPIDTARGAHIGDHAQKFSAHQQTEGVHTGLAADHGIATALERGLYVGHNCGLVFDEEHGQEGGLDGG
jgi:hypothetical protein